MKTGQEDGAVGERLREGCQGKSPSPNPAVERAWDKHIGGVLFLVREVPLYNLDPET